jgi:hypothetical protein
MEEVGINFLNKRIEILKKNKKNYKKRNRRRKGGTKFFK